MKLKTYDPLIKKASLHPDASLSLGTGWEIEIAKKYLDVAGVLIVALNRKGEVTFINKKGCEILGARDESIIGKNWFDHFIPFNIRDKVKEVFDKLMSSNTDMVEYFKNPILADGEEKRYFAWYNTPIKNESKTTIGVLSSGEDITEQKKAEDALRESEERYKTLVQTSPDAVAVTDLEGNITYVSEQALTLYGYASPDEILGKKVQDLIVPEHRAKALLNMKKAIKEGFVRTVEYGLLKRDGTRFLGEMSTAVIKNKHGHPKMFITTTRNCTERKKAEEELLRSIQEKELLLQEIHHRVKNNLQVISSLLDLSSLRIADPTALSLIADAQTKIQTMAFIHNQLYKSERFDSVDMGNHVRDLVHYLKHFYAQNKDISIYVDIRDICLPITKAIPCALVINELVSNAFKHAFNNGDKGIIEITMEVVWGYRISINIRDNGVGLSKNFDIFSTESLGLKLVRNLVRNQLKGKIDMKRRGYTEFHIEFAKNLPMEEKNGKNIGR